MTLPYLDPVTGLRRSEIRHPDGCPPDPGGCRWCGRLPSVHWGAVRGVVCCKCEEWAPPTDAQIRARILAASERVRAQLAVPPPWPVMPRPSRMPHDDTGLTWPRED